MTVTAIRLQNFMAFGETDDKNDPWIELRPITLLFGRNSSGKSAIIRALRLLKQSLDYPGDEASPFSYVVEDGLDVDSFLTIAHGMDHEVYKYKTDSDWLDENKKTVNFGFRYNLSNHYKDMPAKSVHGPSRLRAGQGSC